ncbi:MAG: tyrosine--tRNA ligase [Verrucomicrobiota bacterium]
MGNVIDELKWRGLFENYSSEDLVAKLDSPVTVYAGFDPTSDSLQVGNYVTIKALSHFQRHGHKVIALVGGATGLIGDPSGKSAERVFLSTEKIRKNVEGIRENLSKLIDFEDAGAPAVLVDNNQWLGDFRMIDFLRDVGKHFRMGAMLGKESVRARLNSEAGMSFAEFTYQILQAYDFLKLYDNYNCLVQLGGSDQWGNIVAGIDLVRKLRGAEVFGLTMPLVCDSAGRKFGKSEGNAIYLASDKTSCYDFYQFFVRTDDADVIRLLKIFTFLGKSEIEELESSLKAEPEKREAQKRLAEEMTRTMHGEKGLRVAKQATDVLFGRSMKGLDADELLSIFAHVPSRKLPADFVAGALAVDIAAESGFCKSKGEARRLITSGGFYINNEKVESSDAKIQGSDVIDGRIVVLRSGKKNFFLIEIA